MAQRRNRRPHDDDPIHRRFFVVAIILGVVGWAFALVVE
jgi:hypothetical protein